MFGYVRPIMDRLSAEDRERFQGVYCGLCHTLGKRCGRPARLFLNYDLAFLAMLLEKNPCTACRKSCIVHPIGKRPCADASPALDTAADLSVILTWWQIQDGIADHGFFRGLKYRAASLLLRRAYRKAAEREPDFDTHTQKCLQELAKLEKEQCASVDAVADTFARLLAGAARGETDAVRRRVLEQMLYHLGRWIYLADAADDLKEDLKSGSYNPLPLRYALSGRSLTQESRQELANTMDQSIRVMAAAFELADFGDYTAIIESVVYEGLYVVGSAVLNGTFRKRKKREKVKPNERRDADA